MFLPNLKSVASPVLEIVTIGALGGGCEPPILEIGGRRGSEFEMALVSSYRPSIVIPLSLRVSEILPLLCSSSPLFSTPTSSLLKISPCSPLGYEERRCWANRPSS